MGVRAYVQSDGWYQIKLAKSIMTGAHSPQTPADAQVHSPRVQQVKDGVFDSANVRVDRHPPVSDRFIERPAKKNEK